MARPTKYKKEYNGQAYELCLLGFTDKELAEFFGVAESTLNKWKKEFSEFSESIKRGKAPADAKVAAAVYKRAVGYRYEEITQEVDMSGNLSVSKVVEKEQAPDATSAIFWLKNRQPEKWRDKQDLKVSGDEKKPLIWEIIRNAKSE